MYLLDANILIYAFRKDFPAHKVCRQWLTDTLSQGYTVLSPPINEVALVRICTLPSLGKAAAPIEDVFKFLEDLHAYPIFIHAPTSESVNSRWRGLCDVYKLQGNHVNDAYLAALAIEHGATLVSADRGFGRFNEITWLDPTQKS